jgi:hypothetical protein
MHDEISMFNVNLPVEIFVPLGPLLYLTHPSLCGTNFGIDHGNSEI